MSRADGVRAAGEQALEGEVVLLGQDLRGGHERGLVAVLERDDHREQRDHRLAGAHVALDQPVHGMRRLHVVRDLAQHALLGAGQVEGQDALDRLARARPSTCEGGALGPLPPRLALQGVPELEEEELLEDQPQVGGAARRR